MTLVSKLMMKRTIQAIVSIQIICLLLLCIWKLQWLTTDPQQKPLLFLREDKLIAQEQTIKNRLLPRQLTDSAKPREPSMETMLVTQKQNGARFLYMLQTESCLSEYLQEVIGDPSVCLCNVSVLSFKQKCDKPPPPNVKYIYTGTKTTWGGGRNVLYKEAMNREQEYLYFIIMDDDIVLQLELEKYNNSTPWRKFEEFLGHVEPAVAAVDIENKQWLHRAAKGRINMKCNATVDIDESSEYFSVARYDAAFNAFHNKSIRNILPYTSKFDNTTWNFAAIYINMKIELLYAGHSVLHNQIFATNFKHRPYPRHRPSPQEVYSVIDEVANDIPEKYRSSFLMKGWRKKRLRHEEWSPTVCIPPPPPKMPIIQFGYLDGKLAAYMTESEVQNS